MCMCLGHEQSPAPLSTARTGGELKLPRLELTRARLPPDKAERRPAGLHDIPHWGLPHGGLSYHLGTVLEAKHSGTGLVFPLLLDRPPHHLMLLASCTPLSTSPSSDRCQQKGPEAPGCPIAGE